MKYAGYEITLFRPDLLDGVLSVLRYLWGDASHDNQYYFQWKYLQNPYTDTVLGIVALHEGKVVGFRGYFATRWEITDSDKEIVLLCPGDTCVHPAHRRKRLSLLMGNMAMDDYANRYPVFLNFSANKQSVPGYLRMGFMPLGKKIFMNRSSLLGMMAYILSSKQNKDLRVGKIGFGDFGSVTVSDYPMPEAMAAVISKQNQSGRKIRLLQDEKFFQWRFNNKRKKYVFYYFKQGQHISGYVVVRVSANNRRGFIIDYAVNHDSALKNLLSFISKKKHYNILSIYTYGVLNQNESIFHQLKFKTRHMVRFLERKSEGEWPLFVRPVQREYKEKHFFIQGLDIRQSKNWSMKEICSDGS